MTHPPHNAMITGTDRTTFGPPRTGRDNLYELQYSRMCVCVSVGLLSFQTDWTDVPQLTVSARAVRVFVFVSAFALNKRGFRTCIENQTHFRVCVSECVGAVRSWVNTISTNTNTCYRIRSKISNCNATTSSAPHNVAEWSGGFRSSAVSNGHNRLAMTTSRVFRNLVYPPCWQ